MEFNIRKNIIYNKELFKKISMLAFGILILLIINRFNNILFHALSEIITITIGYAIVILTINSLKLTDKYYFVFLGITLGFVVTLDMFHTLTFMNLEIFKESNKNMSVQLWICARYIEAVSLFLSFRYINKKFNVNKVIAIYTIVTGLMLLSIFYKNIFPDCYNPLYGLTRFKIISECLISIILIISIIKYFKNKNSIKLYDTFIYGILITTVSEIMFIFNTNINTFIFVLGHILKIISFYFFYEAIIKATFKDPFNVMFESINNKAKELKNMNEELLCNNKELENIKINLQKSEERYKMFLEFLPDAILLRDNEKIIYANKSALKLLNYEREEEILGKNFYQFVHKDYEEIVRERMEKQKNGHKVPPLEQKIVCSTGEVLDVEIHSIISYLEGKRYLLTILRDLTGRKKIGEMKLKLQKRIEYDKIRNEFFANISHELKTPINVIYSALQLTDKYMEEGNYEKLKNYNSIIRQNCLRLIRLSNNIIDITKINSGFFKPIVDYYNIVELIELIVDSVVPYTRSQNMNITFDTDSEEEVIRCDPELIERIMLNLLSNSIKYRSENGEILVKIYHDNSSYINISIIDNGIGIPKEVQSLVFERFVQADKSLNRKCEGSGIGLSLVKSLVELQNGGILLKSKEGEGTEFTFRFPIEKGLKEVAATKLERKNVISEDIIDKISVEFSDIYN